MRYLASQLTFIRTCGLLDAIDALLRVWVTAEGRPEGGCVHCGMRLARLRRLREEVRDGDRR